MTDMLYWLGSGVAFAIGVICGVLLFRVAGGDTNKRQKEYRADVDAAEDRQCRMAGAMEKIALIMEDYQRRERCDDDEAK